ncbi:MAG: AMP-dependent synthetase/ligase, partial [Planctomycetota bacterium]
LAEATGIKSKLAGWAMRTELACHRESVRTGKPVNTFSRRLANKLVLSKIRAKLGLDELKLAVTGAAPIAVATLDFFASLGVVIHEGYGMTETSGIATLSEYGRPVAGSVGRAIHGVEIKIADDGEIQLRGRSMVKGYYKLAEKTAELWSEDGWMCTGDLGSVDENGLLRITGRKKDILITAGAKNIAPAEMEAHLMTITGVGQAVVVGDRKPYLCALLVLDPEALPDLREKLSLPADTSLKDVAESDKVREFFEKQIETECNAKVARYQTIKKFEVLPAEFSVDGGELTPTLKVKRNVVNEKYAATIEAMYERETAPVG